MTCSKSSINMKGDIGAFYSGINSSHIDYYSDCDTLPYYHRDDESDCDYERDFNDYDSDDYDSDHQNYKSEPIPPEKQECPQPKKMNKEEVRRFLQPKKPSPIKKKCAKVVTCWKCKNNGHFASECGRKK